MSVKGRQEFLQWFEGDPGPWNHPGIIGELTLIMIESPFAQQIVLSVNEIRAILRRNAPEIYQNEVRIKELSPWNSTKFLMFYRGHWLPEIDLMFKQVNWPSETSISVDEFSFAPMVDRSNRPPPIPERNPRVQYTRQQQIDQHLASRGPELEYNDLWIRRPGWEPEIQLSILGELPSMGQSLTRFLQSVATQTLDQIQESQEYLPEQLPKEAQVQLLEMSPEQLRSLQSELGSISRWGLASIPGTNLVIGDRTARWLLSEMKKMGIIQPPPQFDLQDEGFSDLHESQQGMTMEESFEYNLEQRRLNRQIQEEAQRQREFSLRRQRINSRKMYSKKSTTSPWVAYS